MTVVSVALNNLKQNPLRNGAIFLAILVLTGTLLAISALSTALTHSLELSRKRLGADIMIVPSERTGRSQDVFLMGRPDSFILKDAARLRADLLRTPGVVAVTAQVFVVSAPLPCCSVSETMLIGYEPDTDFVVSPWIGKRAAGNETPPSSGVIAGSDILSGIGGRLRFYGREFVITGKLEPTGMRYLDSGIFIPRPQVRAMIEGARNKALTAPAVGPDAVSSLLVRLDAGANADRIALQIEHDHPGVTALVTGSILRNTTKNIAASLKGMALLFLLQWAASMFLIGALYRLSLDERRRELGILKALGATDGFIRSLLTIEQLLTSGAAALAGAAAGLLLIKAAARYLKDAATIPFVLPGDATLTLLASGVCAAAVLSGLLPSLVSTRRWSRIEPFYLIKGDRGTPGAER